VFFIVYQNTMKNNLFSSEVAEPTTKPETPETPEKIKEVPVKVPNPFAIPTPNIQPNTKPSPKA